MQWIYLSPHLDDVALSVGGLLWEQVQAGENVNIWTICAGDPPPGELSPFAENLHKRWEVGRQAIATRRAEDVQSCKILGVNYHHFSVPDCIYRIAKGSQEHLYASEEALFGDVHPNEESLIQEIGQALEQLLPSKSQVVCPLALGGHVDHRLTRATVEQFHASPHYYADYPYLLDDPNWDPGQLSAFSLPVSQQGITAWQKSIAAHHSQISTFWENITEMEKAIHAYAKKMGGVKLWRKPEPMF
jgi:LmbE family N-acetylglucosaminyl deacetylase